MANSCFVYVFSNLAANHHLFKIREVNCCDIMHVPMYYSVHHVSLGGVLGLLKLGFISFSGRGLFSIFQWRLLTGTYFTFSCGMRKRQAQSRAVSLPK